MLMRECWQPDPDKRPFFTELREKLESQLKRADSEVYTDQMSENMYEILEDLPGEKCWAAFKAMSKNFTHTALIILKFKTKKFNKVNMVKQDKFIIEDFFSKSSGVEIIV